MDRCPVSRSPGAPSGEVVEFSEVTLLGLGVRLREEGLGCGEERCCFRRKRRRESDGDLLFGDLNRKYGNFDGRSWHGTQLLISNRIVMGVSLHPAAARAALSKSDASVMIACLAALPSFAGEASLELAADDVIEFILVSIAEANLKRGNIIGE